MRKHKEPHIRVPFYIQEDLYKEMKDHFKPFKLSHVITEVLRIADADKGKSMDEVMKKAVEKMSRAAERERKKKG